MSLSYKTFNYLPGFACLGGDCEDTCCKDWDIGFDQPHYQLLKETIESHGGDQAQKFSRYIKLNDGDTASDQNFARLKLSAGGRCPFLSADSWCELHQQFGEKPLSNVCAFFPRVLSRRGDIVELSGALSCPEMVRKCLFAEEDIELVDFEPSILPRPDDYPLTRELALPADHFYYDNFVAIRETLLQLSKLEGFSLESRLYFLSNFANRVTPFYHLEAETNNRKLLENELKQAMSLTMLERMSDYVSKYDPADPVAIIVIQAVLQLRIQQFPNETYSQFVKQVFDGYKKLMPELAADEQLEDALPPELFWQCYQPRRTLIDKHFDSELDKCFTRYLINCLYREWFITMPDLFTYIHMLVIRMAILRFLVYSHPKILELAEQLEAKKTTVSDTEISTLREYIVDIFYKNSRAIDHNTMFLKVVYDAIHEQQMMTYEYSLPFIKF